MQSLSGKRALVLGGSRGIGAAVVQRLARDGARVVFTYVSSAEASETLAKKTGATAVRADSADPLAVRGVIEDHGPFDVLVVNAGVVIMGSPLELDPGAVDRLIDVNIRAPYHAAVETARTMPDGGRIVVIGSVNGDRIAFAGGTAYAMSKSALQGLVRGLARDLGPRGITVNNVQPGPIDTDMNPADGPMAGAMHSVMAIQRHGRAEEVAGLVRYLVDPEAAFITGAQHTIDGGFAA